MEQTKLTGYPSIDKPWLKYYSEEEVAAYPPKKTVVKNIYDANKSHPYDTALLYFGRKITYRTLFTKVDEAAKAFLAYGVKCGDNVAICLPAIPEAIYAILGLNKIGANANMLNPTFEADQLTARIFESNAEVLVVLQELYGRLACIIPQTKVKTVISCPAVNSLGLLAKLFKKKNVESDTISWKTFIRNGKDTALSEVQYIEDHPAITVYSSGTTGASKGIQLTNDSINWAIVENTPKTYGFERGKRYFLQIPIWFSTGIVTTGLVPLYYGVSLILEPMYDFTLFQKHITKYKPNYIITAASLVEYLMKVDNTNQLGKNWICLAIGGEYAPPKMEERVNKWLKRCGNEHILRKGYGMCECGGSSVTSQVVCNVLGTAGVPTPHVTIASFDLITEKERGYNQRGELRVITPCRMLCYYNRIEETKKRLHTDTDGNTWVCTGDMGFVSEDGNITVCGRISDSYTNEKNETIYLFDIERAVLDIDGVRQCKAITFKQDQKTTHLCHLVLSDGADIETILHSIKAHCIEALPKSYRPMIFHVYDDALPVAPSGKLDIAKMRNDVDNLIIIESDN